MDLKKKKHPVLKIDTAKLEENATFANTDGIINGLVTVFADTALKTDLQWFLHPDTLICTQLNFSNP